MMADKEGRPFESIESALEFMVLLGETIDEASMELQGMLKDTGEPRRAEALNLALFKINQLASHTHKSRRILNDLRLVRTLLVRKDEPQPAVKAVSSAGR